MYKVFLNDRKINIGAKRNITLNQPQSIIDFLHSIDDVQNVV